MKHFDEIARVAYDLYEKSGRIPGRDEQNWIEAEKIVRARYAVKETNEPEAAKAEKKPAVEKKTAAKTSAKKAETGATEPKKTATKRRTKTKE
jgi:hypothetical protein